MSHPGYSNSRPPTRGRDSTAASFSTGDGYASSRRTYSSSPPRSTGVFPERWSLYQPGWKNKLTIGEHQDAPLHAVIPHSGLFGRPRLALHSGTSDKSPVLAKVKKPVFAMRNRHGFYIHLPSASHESSASGSAASSSDDGKPPADEVVKVTSHRASLLNQRRTYRFSTSVSALADSSRWGRRRAETETFEWRHQHGGAAQEILRAGKHDGRFLRALNLLGGCWVLVQLPPPPQTRGHDPYHPIECVEEIVAVWGEEASMHKKLTFAFVNSGASLGSRFAELAVATSMALWDDERRQRQAQAMNNNNNAGI